MDLITDEFLSARTGEPLEARLRKSDKFQQHMKSLHTALQAFTKDTSISKRKPCGVFVSESTTGG